jgi:hypothetical protein
LVVTLGAELLDALELPAELDALELDEPVELEELDDPVPAGVPPLLSLGPVVLTAAGGAATETVWVLKDSRPTSPATVPKTAKRTRRMSGSLFLERARSERERLVVDLAARHAGPA